MKTVFSSFHFCILLSAEIPLVNLEIVYQNLPFTTFLRSAMASLVDAVEMATPAEICSKPLLDPVGPAADQYTPTAPTKEGHAESQARPGPTQEMENTADESTQPVGQAPGFDGGDTRATRAGNTPKAVPSQQDETLLVFSDMWNGTGTYDVNWSRCSSWEASTSLI